MRVVFLCVFFIILSSLALSQSEKLPDILKPDAASEAEAQRMGANVFKLVPRGMFPGPPGLSYKDEENQIGIRGGGAYFSFATGSHSYNRIPEIELQNGSLQTGFAGYDYGFLADVGPRDIKDIETSPEAKYFLSYRHPIYERDLRTEQHYVQSRQIEELALTLRTSVPAKTGDTYLLRAVSWDLADTAVAFRVLKIDEDGSVTITWKSLAEFPKPFYLFMSDDELRQEIDEVTAEEKLVGVEFTVKDNSVYVTRPDKINLLYYALSRHGIRYRGVIGLTPGRDYSATPIARPTPLTTDSRDLTKYGIVDYDALQNFSGVEAEKRKKINSRYDNQEWVVPKINDPEIGGTGRIQDLPVPPLFPFKESCLVVVGEVKEWKAYLSNDKQGVYTEFKIKIDEVLKDDATQPGLQELVVDRGGGVVRYPNGQRVIYESSEQMLPQSGFRYLFFLSRDDVSPNYRIVTGYEFRDGKVRPTEDGRSTEDFKSLNELSFLRTARERLKGNDR